MLRDPNSADYRLRSYFPEYHIHPVGPLYFAFPYYSTGNNVYQWAIRSWMYEKVVEKEAKTVGRDIKAVIPRLIFSIRNYREGALLTSLIRL